MTKYALISVNASRRALHAPANRCIPVNYALADGSICTYIEPRRTYLLSDKTLRVVGEVRRSIGQCEKSGGSVHGSVFEIFCKISIETTSSLLLFQKQRRRIAASRRRSDPASFQHDNVLFKQQKIYISYSKISDQFRIKMLRTCTGRRPTAKKVKL